MPSVLWLLARILILLLCFFGPIFLYWKYALGEQFFDNRGDLKWPVREGKHVSYVYTPPKRIRHRYRNDALIGWEISTNGISFVFVGGLILTIVMGFTLF